MRKLKSVESLPEESAKQILGTEDDETEYETE